MRQWPNLLAEIEGVPREFNVSSPINPNLARVFAPPVMEAFRWVSETSFPADRPLLNLSQAAPVEPPPQALCKAMAEASLNDPGAHLYGPVLGDTELREEIARLQPNFKDAYVLCSVRGLSYDEAGAICGCPAKTISTRLARARKQLVKRMEKWL